MLHNDQNMFLLLPGDSEKRVLQPGKVIESSAPSFSIAFDEPIELPVGLDTLAFCEVRGKFFQQGASLVEVREGGPASIYVFNRVGDPVSAEQRQTFRVSVAAAQIYAQLGKQKQCLVVDISPEGLAVIADAGLTLGSMQKISTSYEQNTILADARIQTIKILPSGKARYGLLIPSSDAVARKTLLKTSMDFQRRQLKRLAGAA